MEADFSGWATKAGLKCSDGRTIMSGAFRHQDQTKVPLVWQHGHTDPENVLGHAILENREEGVYAYGFLNGSQKAKHAGELLEHKDINQMSIWANQLVERGQKVLHGAIREVSLVLAGANPGALIENVTIRHGEDDETMLDDEVIITTGLELEHESPKDETKDLSHATGDEGGNGDAKKTDTPDDEETVQDVYDSMTDKQKQVLHFMLGEALEAAKDELEQDGLGKPEDKKDNLGHADGNADHSDQSGDKKDSLGHADDNSKGTSTNPDDKKDKDDTTMTHNVFENDKKDKTPHVLSHDDMQGIFAVAAKTGSLKDAVDEYALAHGIDDIEVLFPEARALTSAPELDKRRTEWVSVVLNGARKSPFSRIKTLSADLTVEEARAKGYVTGDLKKEEYFAVARRVTTPTTIYKKQKLDRDDLLDISDFDVVAWLKAEMRLMLDEELARAILLGDGRDIAHEDKINEGNIRPIAKDHQLFTTTITVNLDDASSSAKEIINALVLNRRYFKGTGMPTMFTTETIIATFMLLEDTTGRRIYRSLDDVVAELRVAAIVPVEVMEEETSVVAVLVNMNDYNIGADRGGNVTMFDGFDIDYNQHKYLIETRVSGAMTKLKGALVVKRAAAGTDTPVTPAVPTFNGTAVTIVDTTGVVYKDAADDSVVNAAGSPYAVPEGEASTIYAQPAAGRYFESSAGTTWTFRNRG